MSVPYYDAPRDELVLVKGYRHLAVSLDGKVFNRTNNTYIKPSIAKSKSPKVVTTTAGVTLRFRLGFLIAAAFIPLPYGFILPRDVDKLDLEYVDGDYNNLELVNLRWVIRPDIPFLLSEAAGEDRIFELKSVPGLAASRKGDVYSLQTGNKLSVRSFSNSYLRVEPYLDKRFMCVLHHRIMGELFVPPKDGYAIEQCVAELVINHKNSIRDDNRPENLEWVTSKENTAHGFEQDRMVRNQRLKVKDVVTGTVKEYQSLLEFTEAVDLHSRVINGLFNAGVIGQVIIKGQIVCSFDDADDFMDHVNLSSNYYRVFQRGEHVMTATPQALKHVLPALTARVNSDGTVSEKTPHPYRASSWDIRT